MTGQQIDDGDGRRADERDDEHLEGVEDGCGCVEVWEHLAERRDAEGETN